MWGKIDKEELYIFTLTTRFLAFFGKRDLESFFSSAR
jgi:hypothetical protein